MNISLSSLIVTAARKALLRYIQEFVEKNNFPAKDWPQPVKDELFKHIKITIGTPQSLPLTKGKTPSLGNYKPLLEEFAWEYSKEPETLTINTDLSSFDPESQGDLHVRMNDTVNVKDDTKRHEFQKSQFQGQSDLINKDPVIVQIKGLNKLHLVEGWHRTAQLLKEARARGLKKVQYRAYVGRKGGFMGKIDYYVGELGKYLTNEETRLDQSQREKMPYREVLKTLKEKGSLPR